MQPLLETLNLLNKQPLRQEYAESIARQVALERVMAHLKQIEARPGLDPEFYRYQSALIQGELNNLSLKVEKILDENPNLQNFVAEKLKEELRAIEADTYADLVRAGQLTKELSPFLESFEELA
jgi:CPA1 family monovalent cation:H+ antiporter